MGSPRLPNNRMLCKSCRLHQPCTEPCTLTCQPSGSSSLTLAAKKTLSVTVCEEQVRALAMMAPRMEKGSMV